MQTTKTEQRAKGIARMGLVENKGDYYRVATPSLRGHQTFYTVKNETCTCLDFQHRENPDEKCEHLLAVEYSNATTKIH